MLADAVPVAVVVADPRDVDALLAVEGRRPPVPVGQGTGPAEGDVGVAAGVPGAGATAWSALDYLIIDMPPGTGDIQLSLAQTVAVRGAVIVTTPQDIALSDARKGIEMFKKVGVPVLGVVENMSVHICNNCGHAEAIFGSGGGDRLAQDYGVEVIGRLPLDINIREQTDLGVPVVASSQHPNLKEAYAELARGVHAQALAQEARANAAPMISVADD